VFPRALRLPLVICSYVRFEETFGVHSLVSPHIVWFFSDSGTPYGAMAVMDGGALRSYGRLLRVRTDRAYALLVLSTNDAIPEMYISRGTKKEVISLNRGDFAGARVNAWPSGQTPQDVTEYPLFVDVRQKQITHDAGQ